MCGIVGYAGHRVARDVLLDSLKRLEYRGYDSAGIATVGDAMVVDKVQGRIEDLREAARDTEHVLGIGHTRWATHGEPSQVNAHPHQDCTGRWGIVHNGIVDNHLAVKRSLESKGHEFVSETDTEIVAHLLEEQGDVDPTDAVRRSIDLLKGSWAICAVSPDHPDRIVGARRQAPLVVGLGDRENFVASDVTAILPYTRRVVYLEDGDVALVSASDVEILDADGEPVQREPQTVDWTWEDAEKGGFEHYMLKEIHETPRAFADTLLGRVREAEARVDLGDADALLEGVDRLKIIACGTSMHAGLVGKYAVEAIADVPVSVEVASEYRYGDLPADRSLVVAVSQSGETADTMAGVREAKRRGLDVLGVTNVPGSSITREADAHLLTRAGPEIGVAASKTFVAQLATLYLVALRLGRANGALSPARAQELIAALRRVPRDLQWVLDREATIAEHSVLLAGTDHCLYIGRHINYPSALEGALKLKEISYVHAEGYPAGELKHGPFALLDADTPVVALAPKDHTYEKMVGNIGEIKARGAPVIAIVGSEDRDVPQIAEAVLRLPDVEPILTPLPIAVVLQLLAYHVAVKRSCPVDKPRNLAKSVTVE